MATRRGTLAGLLSGLAAAAALAASGLPVAASELFQIRSSDGSRTVAVTEAMIEEAGPVTMQAILAGSDGQKQTVRGPRLRDLLAHTGFSGSAVLARAHDDYEMVVPAEDYMTYDVVVAIEVDGQRLSLRTRGPAWIVYPTVEHPQLMGDVYQARSVWQIRDLTVQ